MMKTAAIRLTGIDTSETINGKIKTQLILRQDLKETSAWELFECTAETGIFKRVHQGFFSELLTKFDVLLMKLLEESQICQIEPVSPQSNQSLSPLHLLVGKRRNSTTSKSWEPELDDGNGIWYYRERLHRSENHRCDRTFHTVDRFLTEINNFIIRVLSYEWNSESMDSSQLSITHMDQSKIERSLSYQSGIEVISLEESQQTEISE